MSRQIAHIGLGSNLSDRQETLFEATKLMDAAVGVSVRRVSSFIETDPVGGPGGQDKYLNAAAEIETTLSPDELLAALQGIERSLGRRREDETRWGPRTCDLDILLMGRTVLESEELTIPHPQLAERLFVLQPLAEIAPQVVHPAIGKTVAELLADLQAERGDGE